MLSSCSEVAFPFHRPVGTPNTDGASFYFFTKRPTDTPSTSAIFNKVSTVGPDLDSFHFPIVPLPIPALFSSAEMLIFFLSQISLMFS